MKKIFKLLSIAVLLVIIGIAVLLFFFPEKLLYLFVPEIEQVSEIKAYVKKDTAYIDTRLVAKNGTFLTVKMDTLKYKISYNHINYFHDKKSLGLIIKRFDKDTFDFSFKIPYADILKDMKSKHKGEHRDFISNLSLQFSTIFGKAELPLINSEKLSIPEPPELEVLNLKLKKGSVGKKIIAEVNLKVTNHSSYSLSINKMNYSISVFEVAKVMGEYTKPLNFKGNSVTKFNLPIEVELKNGDNSIMDILRDNELHHYLLFVDGTFKSSNLKQEKTTHLVMTKEDDVILLQ